MAGAVAHHFNNQLQAVIGYLEMALDGLPPGNRPRTNVIEALKASHKASGISGMMLTYLGQNSGNRVPLDLSETCRRTLPMLRSAMQEGTVLEADLPCPGPVIKANAGQIQQVLANLIYNAMEAVGDEKGVIRVAVRTVSKAGIPTVQRFPIDWQPQDSPYACLEVADTGCGILGANLANIFDPFYSSKFTGRGLGLAVVFGIVRAHCGAVTVESDTGRGSVFRVFLPVCASQLDTHDPVGPSSPPLYKGDMG
jgi:signal transduction histidine kinase